MDDRTRNPFAHDTGTPKKKLHWIKRVGIVVGGFTVLTVGIAMIVLPGPAIVVIPAGLGILSLEFDWARRWLHEIKERGGNLVDKVKRKRDTSA